MYFLSSGVKGLKSCMLHLSKSIIWFTLRPPRLGCLCQASPTFSYGRPPPPPPPPPEIIQTTQEGMSPQDTHLRSTSWRYSKDKTPVFIPLTPGQVLLSRVAWARAHQNIKHVSEHGENEYNRVSYFPDYSLKQGQGFIVSVAHPHSITYRVPPSLTSGNYTQHKWTQTAFLPVRAMLCPFKFMATHGFSNTTLLLLSSQTAK